MYAYTSPQGHVHLSYLHLQLYGTQMMIALLGLTYSSPPFVLSGNMTLYRVIHSEVAPRTYSHIRQLPMKITCNLQANLLKGRTFSFSGEGRQVLLPQLEVLSINGGLCRMLGGQQTWDGVAKPTATFIGFSQFNGLRCVKLGDCDAGISCRYSVRESVGNHSPTCDNHRCWDGHAWW